ncbi:MAG: homocysteine S-methyltransferase family protein [Lachnospiraceae bacterium]|nr:homocysteine S-methyltransferase family protein [Lachnospiraceae bacterium]
MTKKEFAVWAKENIIYLDGATGSNLMKAGMPAGVCPEKWILEHEDVFVALQEAYVKAGSNILYAPTFTANRIKLKEYGLDKDVFELTKKLVALSRRVAGEKALIAGDITMTGEQLSPMGKMDFEELVEVYKEQILALTEAGVDMLVVETMMSLQESRAALIAAKETCDLPVMVTLTFEKDGRTLYGTDAATMAVVLSTLGADAIGANCSTGPAAMTETIRTMAEVADIPIIAKPNAGLPYVDEGGNTCYDMKPLEFAEEMKCLVEAGASVLGGCCGTNPAYIEALVNTFGNKREKKELTKAGIRYLSSERQTAAFSLDDNFFVVGERINPTGKKKLQAALREGSLDMVKDFAEEQEACGARILDVNMGMGGIDEKEMMLRALEEISTVTNLPLSLDSSHIDVLEAALRRYPGRALVNSVSYEKEKFEKLLPIVKKYGAMFILLPLSDEGLPADLEEKKGIINKILERALSLGFTKEDIVVDGLVTTVGANKKAALETLETIRYCKENGLATICGLSNISFGMPERSYVNTAFLTMAIQAGLTMAIANPSQELLMGCAFASDLLLNKEESDMRYISYAEVIKEKREAKEQAMREEVLLSGQAVGDSAGNAIGSTTGGSNTESKKGVENSDGVQFSPIQQKLRDAVLKGNKNGIVQITKDALAEGNEPKALLDDILLPAINTVGDYFDNGKYFLPQLIAGAEAMKLSIEVLEPLMLSEQSGQDMPVVVIATVEGDIHDIGKNLVALMLKNYGFKVVDLGKDVSKETIIEAAKEQNASIIALSALMTTTMKQMKEVILYAQEQGVKAKIMVGGAVITQEYADEIGADGYSKDAADAVKLAGRLLKQLQQ